MSSGGSVVCSASIRASSPSGGYPIVIRTAKRSSWASGSGYVPSYSTGFWVAMTRNGRSSTCVAPSTVTCVSCIASRSEDWVFGEARLISSTRRTLAKTGPGPEAEGAALAVEDVDPRDVRREQVGCELHPVEGQVERAGDRLREHGLADAGHVFDEHVALREEAEERQPQRLRRARGSPRRGSRRRARRARRRRRRVRTGSVARSLTRVPRAAPRPRRGSRRRSPASAPSRPAARPSREISRTSLSRLSKPMSARPTSL